MNEMDKILKAMEKYDKLMYSKKSNNNTFNYYGKITHEQLKDKNTYPKVKGLKVDKFDKCYDINNMIRTKY